MKITGEKPEILLYAGKMALSYAVSICLGGNFEI
jgi:hypothetical protein